MPPFIIISIGAGILSAVLFASAVSGMALSIVPIYLSPLPLFLAGLGYGGGGAIIAGISGAAALLLAGGPMLAIAYFLFNAAAPAVLSRVAAWSRTFTDSEGREVVEWYPAGYLFVWLAGLGIALMLLLALLAQTLEGGLSGLIPQQLQIDLLAKTIIQAQIQAGSTPMDETVLQNRLIRLALPGLALYWTLIAIGNSALAQRLLVQFGRQMRPSPDLLNMFLPGFILWPLLGGTLLAFFPGDLGLIGLVVATLTAIPYFFLGLATVHVISHRLSGRSYVLTAFYILLILLGWPSLLIIGLGIVEHFTNLRQTYSVTRP